MIRAACAVLATSLALPAAGVEPAAANGEVLAAPCSGCHDARPAGDGQIPDLTGLSTEVIAEKLLAYRDDRLDGTLMNRIARGYSEPELRMIASYLGGARP